MEGKIIFINISKKKGVSKENVPEAELKENFGLVGDAHSGSAREVSLLGWERVQNWLKAKSIEQKIKAGDFAENLTTSGIDWNKIKVGDRIQILPHPPSRIPNPESHFPILLEISQIGKPCHSACAIRKQVGDCLMPKEGIFAKVLQGGKIKVGDKIRINYK